MEAGALSKYMEKECPGKTANQVIMAVMQKDWEYAAKNLDYYVGKSYAITKDRDASGKEIDTSTHIR